MKKTILAILVISLFILSACGTGTTPKTSEQTPTNAPSANADENAQKYVKIETAKTAAEATGCKGADNYEKLKATMENPDEIMKMALAVNSYLDVKVGECVIFPIAVRNEFLDNKEFSIDVYFKKATDRAPIANVLTADTATMNTWITPLETKTITPHQYTIYPLKITVGDMITSSDKTVAGTYRFGFQAYYKAGDVSRMKYEPEKEVFVRVME